MKSIIISFILVSLLFLSLAENLSENVDKKKWLELLMDVDAPNINATQSLVGIGNTEKLRKNIILFISDATTETKDVADQLKQEFPIHGFCKVFDDTQSAPVPQNLVKLLGGQHTRSVTKGCSNLLQSNIASLVEWARNDQQMTTGVVTVTNASTVSEIQSPTNSNITIIQNEEDWSSGSYDQIPYQETSDEKKNYLYPFRPDLFNSRNDPRKINKISQLEKKQNSETVKTSKKERDDVAIPPAFDDDEYDEPLMVTPVIRKYKREVYYSSNPERKLLIKPITGDDPKYNKWNIFDLMRKSFLDDFMVKMGINAKASDENANLDIDQLGSVREPSYYQLVRNALNDIESQSSIDNDNGFLLVITGGRPERSAEFTEGVRYVLNNISKYNTLVVVTGNCPKETSNDIRSKKMTRFGRKLTRTVPYFASGFGSESLKKVNHLYEIPEAIKSVFEEIRSDEKSTRSINEAKNFKISESEEYQHSGKKPEDGSETKYLEYVISIPKSSVDEEIVKPDRHASNIEGGETKLEPKSTSSSYDETPSALMIVIASFLRFSFKYLLCY